MKNTSRKIITIVSILVFFTASLSPVLAISPAQNPVSSSLFDQRMTFLMRLSGFSALSACIIKNDSIIWSNAYGITDRDEKQPATTGTIYVLASITKTVVGTALLQLYDQGLFGLDDDVNLYLPFDLRNPNFPDDPITIRMLLSHTSSLNTNNQNNYYWMNFSGDPPFSFFPDPYLSELLLPGGQYYDPSLWSTIYRPGEHAMYANVGFDLISYLIELISGESFLEYCDIHLFAPLDMPHTGFNLSRLPLENVAIPYQRFAGRYYQINELTFLFGNIIPPEKYWRARFYPAGGLYSTVMDLSHFLIMHMNDGVYNGTQILKKETVALMHQIDPDNRLGYGLAWMQSIISRHLTATGHAGDLPGADTWMLYNQTEDLGIIYFANGNPYYSLLPLKGLLSVQFLLYSLFMKHASFLSTFVDESPLMATFTSPHTLMIPARSRTLSLQWTDKSPTKSAHQRVVSSFTIT
jgi:CubicO group peptidase (beta-lactamase class C family)